MKRRAKRAFLLTEALVAITILFVGGFLFFEIQSSIIKKEKLSTKRVQAEIAYQLALSQLVVDLHKKKFNDDIDREFVTDHIVLEDNKKWQAKYQFQKNKPIEPTDPGYIVSVKIISLLHSEWGEFVDCVSPQQVAFEFCVKK